MRGIRLKMDICKSFLLMQLMIILTVLGEKELPSYITNSIELTKSDSPYIAQKDVFVPRGVTLTVQPGVVVKFAPRKKLQINGRLIARGTQNERVVFTKLWTNTSTDVNLVSQDATLVDGEELRFGTLHLFYRGRWRPVCSQNKDWLKVDSKVACQQMGYLEGNFTLLERAENDTHHMLYSTPACFGNESSILNCPGASNILVGSNICNFQDLVGLVCWGIHSDYYHHYWKGIELYNSTLEEVSIDKGGNTRLNISNSILEFMDIFYAGVNETGHQVAALSASPHAPKLQDVTVANCAYDGINFTHLTGPALLNRVSVHNNIGHGINISTAVGYVRLNEIDAQFNGGAGTYIRMLPYHWPEEAPELALTAKPICGQSSSSSSPQFPFMLLVEQPGGTTMDGSCVFQITTDKPDQKLTISILEAMRDPLGGGQINIFDRWLSKEIAIWNFNQSIPSNRPDLNTQTWWSARGDIPLYRGVVSNRNQLTVTFYWSKKIARNRCPYFAPCLRVLLQVSVGDKIMNPEVIVRKSRFHKNKQSGLLINNAWSAVHVLDSIATENGYPGGIKIVNGSAEVFVNNTQVIGNDRCGINITTAAGVRIVNASRVTHNKGHGIDIWNPEWPRITRMLSPDYPDAMETQIFHSTVEDNFYHGARFYNACNVMNILVNDSYFRRNGQSGIEAVSCLENSPIVSTILTNLTLFNCTFVSNSWNALMVEPMGNMIGAVLNSTFLNHSAGVVYFDNSDNFLLLRLYQPLFVNYFIRDCRFLNNAGSFVVSARLTEGSNVQTMRVSHNIFEDNRVSRAANHLNPRSSVHAVLVISSTNVVAERNYFKNPLSFKEIGTHLTASNKKVNVSLNFWGSKEYWGVSDWQKVHEKIFQRIFDNTDRFTLAKLVYYPVLKERNLYSTFTTREDPPYIHLFVTNPQIPDSEGLVSIGGIMDPNYDQREIDLPKKRYRVTRDIFIPFGTTLKIAAGSQLLFDNSVGMFIQGQVLLTGTANEPINMTLYNSPDSPNLMLNSSWVDENDTIHEVPVNTSNGNNNNVSDNLSLSNLKVRLVDVITLDKGYTFQGRLEVSFDEKDWGGVCAQDFDWRAARIVCNTLGLVAHDKFWLPPREQWSVNNSLGISSNSSTTIKPIKIANLRCREWQTRLSDCVYDIGPNDHDCHSMDSIYVRCHQPGWGGVRTTLTSQESIFRHIHLHRAGMMDYFRLQYAPGLQIDYNYDVELTNIKIKNGLSDGLSIMHNDLWSDRTVLHSQFHNNLGHGIMLRSPYLRLENCSSINNAMSGFTYDVGFTEKEAFTLRASMYKTKQLMPAPDAAPVRSITLEGFKQPLPLFESSISVHTTKMEIAVAELPDHLINRQAVYRIKVEASDVNLRQMLVFSVVDFNPREDIENVTVFDSNIEHVDPLVTMGWVVSRDLSQFPIISSGKEVTIQIVVNGTFSNRLCFVIHPKELLQSSAQNYYPPTYLNLSNSEFHGNEYGIRMRHYNDPSDRDANIFIRHRQENILLYNLQLSNNRAQAIHIPSVSKYNTDWFAPTYSDAIEVSARIARIFYHMQKCNIINNENGILFAEHNHVVFSNNVWRYLFEDNLFDNNSAKTMRDSMAIDLPFVSKRFDWRYEANTTHQLIFQNNQFKNNLQFNFRITGYTAEIVFNKNEFTDNDCLNDGILSLEGMEKSLTILENEFRKNKNCRYIVQLDTVSQSEYESNVQASIFKNVMIDNQCPPIAETEVAYKQDTTGTALASSSDGHFDKCSTIIVMGLQNVTVRRNILSNPNPSPSYELVSGLLNSGYHYQVGVNKLRPNTIVSSSFMDYFDARENYWGMTNVSAIRNKIFDFEDWNSFACVNFMNFLLQPNVNTMDISSQSAPNEQVNFDVNFGGRIDNDLLLIARREPYIVTRDITVMEGATLSIEQGVRLQFQPSVGILVLGRLLAQGTTNRPVIMEPVPLVKSSSQRIRRDLVAGSPMYSHKPKNGRKPGEIIRQGKNIRLVSGQEENEGFVQFYNATVNRWDLACDSQISPEVGMVLCRELGIETFNALVYESYLYDFQTYGFENPFVSKYIWMESYLCHGGEQNRSLCVRRLNYDAYNCQNRQGFRFLRCAEQNLNTGRYWGGIRILQNRNATEKEQSILEQVKIIGAGVLHGKRAPAVFTFAATPRLSFLHISQCAWNGVDMMSPSGPITIANSTMSNNLGYGFGLLILNGASTNEDKTPYIPMKLNHLPYDVLGMLDMCSPIKELYVQNRLLVFYKYSYQTRACTKLFRSAVYGRQVAMRFMQINLYHDPFSKNSIEMFNGDMFNITELIKEITALNTFTEDDRRLTYKNAIGYDVMGVHIHASAANPTYGFIAEVITLPFTVGANSPDLSKRLDPHNIQDCEFHFNQAGGINFAAIGEISRDFRIYYNRFTDNGLAVLNITSAPVIRVDYQNGLGLDLSNNYIHQNRGTGIDLQLYHYFSEVNRHNVTNNVITRTTHGGAMWIKGNYRSLLTCRRNFISHNDCEERDVIAVHGTLMNPFAYNFISDNRGSVILNITGLDELERNSIYEWNGFSSNQAINYTRRTTVAVANTKNTFRNNYFRNMLNNFEISAGNASAIKTMKMQPGTPCPVIDQYCITGWTPREEIDKCICYRKDSLDAQNNWWGEESDYYVQGRVWEKSDDDYLFPIDYKSSYKSNLTVLGGGMYCPPTWAYKDDHCYWYLGAPLNYSESKEFCYNEGGSILVDSRNRVHFLTSLMADWQNNYAWINNMVWSSRIWVQSEIRFIDFCASIKNFWLEGYYCNKRLPFICQKSPYGIYDGIQVEVVAAVGSIFMIILLFIVLLLLFCYLKSRKRKQQRILRDQALKRLVVPMTRIDAVVNAPANSSGSTYLLSPVSLNSQDMPGSTLASDQPLLPKAGQLKLVDNRVTLTRDAVPLLQEKPTIVSPSNSQNRYESLPQMESLNPNRRTMSPPTQLAEKEIPLLPAGTFDSTFGNRMRIVEPAEPNFNVYNKQRLQRPSNRPQVEQVTMPSPYMPPGPDRPLSQDDDPSLYDESELDSGFENRFPSTSVNESRNPNVIRRPR